MSEYIMGFALVGALLVAAPSVLADYELFKEWREEQGAVYPEGAEVVTLFTIGRDGDLGATNGNFYGSSNDSAWTVEKNYQDSPNKFWINFDSSELAKYYDIGIALTGSYGRTADLLDVPAGLAYRIYLWTSLTPSGTWWPLVGANVLPSALGIVTQIQSYLDGVKTNSERIDVTHDAMQTFMWFSDFDAVLNFLTSSDGGFGVQFATNLRNGSSFSIVAIRKTEVPEPATLGVIGAGLAGLGLARRWRK